MSTTRRRAFALSLALAAALVPVTGVAGPAAAASGPTAMSLVRGMAHQGVPLTHRRSEAPAAAVDDGLCSHLADGGCVRAVISKDASLLLFGTAQAAADFTGCGDDRAVRVGRTVVSFGSPARVGPARQKRYVAAVRRYRAQHVSARTDLDRMVQALQRRGLPMRDAHADEGETRPGLASTIPGAVDMAATKQVDVVVFGTVRAAQDYAGGADDQVVRRGRVVLSFGNPALLGRARQARYAVALRRAMRSPTPSYAAARTTAAAAVPAVVAGCGG